MSSRLQYFHKQKLSEDELNLGFALLEQADRDLAADAGIFGILTGMQPSPHHPVLAQRIVQLSPT